MSFQKKVNFEPTTSYLLKNLKPFSAYTFQLAAKSKHGIGAYTNEVSINTPQTRRSTHKYRRGWMCVYIRARERSFCFNNAKTRRINSRPDWPDSIMRNLAVVFCIVKKDPYRIHAPTDLRFEFYNKQQIFKTQNISVCIVLNCYE